MAQAEQMRPQTETLKPGFDKDALKRVEEGQPGLHGPYGIAALYNKKLSKFKMQIIYAYAGEDTVQEILTRMSVSFIHGIPVVRRNERKEITELLGFVDLLDILAHLLKSCGVSEKELSDATIEKIGTFGKEFRKAPIENVLDLAGSSRYAVIDENTTLGQALPLLKEHHRIAIKDNTGRLTGIITQSFIANYLAKNLGRIKMDPRLDNTLENFPFKTDNVVVIDRNTRVLDAFLQMHTKKLSALAVVDDKGKLCGNLSASDLKGWHMFETRMRLLVRPVGRFLKHIRKFQFKSEDFMVTLNKKNTWFDLLKTFQKHSVRRVYLIDDNCKPTGVISLTDFMGAIAPSTAPRKEELPPRK